MNHRMYEESKATVLTVLVLILCSIVVTYGLFFEPSTRFSRRRLSLILFIIANAMWIGTLAYVWSAISGQPPPWPFPPVINVGFMDGYAIELHAYVCILAYLLFAFMD